MEHTKMMMYKGSGLLYNFGFRIYDATIAKFLFEDPLTKSYPMLTTYQFASNSPSSAIDLDGLEAWIVITEKYGESDPINIMVFVNDFRFMGGVYEVHKDYDMNNVQVGLSGNFESYLSYPAQFTRQGSYKRLDGKKAGYEFEIYASLLYGEVGIKVGKNLGIEFGVDGEMAGVSYSSRDGFDTNFLEKVGEHK